MTANRWLLAASLLCLLLYVPGLFGPFTFDSVVALVRNASLGAEPGSLQAWLVAIDSSAAGPTGRPLSMLTFALSHALIGHSALLEKSINLLIHLAVGGLIFHWLRLLLQSAPALAWSRQQAEHTALAATLLWLLSPMQVSTVLYTVQRMEQLSALFTVLGLHVYTAYRSRWLDSAATAQDLSRALFLITLLGLFAVLTKEDGVLLLPLLALLECLLFCGQYNGRRLPLLRWSALGLCLLPLAVVISLAILEPQWLLQRGSWRGIDSGERLLTQARLLWYYVSWFYWPDVNRMSLFHDDIVVSRGWWQPWTTGLALTGWVALIVLSLGAARRRPILALCIGIFLITHSIESSVIPLDLVYEHRSYLGNIALALLLVSFFYPRVPPTSRKAVVLVLLVPFCLALAWRSFLWGDELRLYEAQLRHHPQSERTVYYYANVRMRLADDVDDAKASREHILAARRYFEYLLELDPQHFPGLVSLLYIDSRWFPGLERGEVLDALQAAASQRVMEPSDGNALELLNRCLAAGFCEVPEENLLAIIATLRERYPGNPSYPVFLARYYGEVMDDYPLAIHFSKEAIAARPGDTSGYYLLASWYLAQGQNARAAEVLGELLVIAPDLATLRAAQQALPQ